MAFSDCDRIAQLCNALDSSASFYTEAQSAAHTPTNAAIFGRIAKARSTIINHLHPFTLHDYSTPRFYAFGSALQKVYPDMFLGLEHRSDPALVAISQQTENELCDLLKDTLNNVQSPSLHDLLLDLFPELNGTHPLCILEQVS